jgi:hypothetical protein
MKFVMVQIKLLMIMKKKHNVDLLNFWCECCARDAINEIEGYKK